MEGDPAAAPVLARVLADPSEDDLTRAQAAASLGRMAAGRAHEAVLVAALEDGSAVVRRDAAEACGRLGIASAVEALAERLRKDSDVHVRRAAAVALGRMGEAGRGAGAALVDGLADPDPGVRLLSAESLETVTGRRLGRDRAAWAKWLAESAGPTETNGE
jgi:HEAT repeat protein